MKPPQTPPFDAFHAHVYFDAASVDKAEKLTEEAARRFTVTLGRMHRRPVGPHPAWSRQLAFDATVYRDLVDWLDANRDGLTILVHGESGDELEDHTTHAWWLGEPAILDVEMFRE